MAADLQQKFDFAVKYIQSLPKNGKIQPNNDQKLKFYGLFKRATAGKNTTSKPYFFNPVAVAKWDAWTKVADKTEEQCKQEYVDELVKVLVAVDPKGIPRDDQDKLFEAVKHLGGDSAEAELRKKA